MTLQKALLKAQNNGGKPVRVTLPRTKAAFHARQIQELLGATIVVYQDHLTADIIVRASYLWNRREYGFEESMPPPPFFAATLEGQFEESMPPFFAATLEGQAVIMRCLKYLANRAKRKAGGEK